jgi:hypothetical protein
MSAVVRTEEWPRRSETVARCQQEDRVAVSQDVERGAFG